jgi:CBS-domain-containing membrane protein
MSLLRQGKAQALTIYLGESDQWHGTPTYVAIVQYLREQGCAGATVTRAVEGYGAGARLHESGGWRLSSDAPLVIQVVDQPERLRRLLPHLQEMLSGGLMTLHEVEVLKYTHARRHGISSKLLVQQVMEAAVTTVNLDTPVAGIIDILLSAPFRALPVVDTRHKLQGIISTGDLIRAGVLPMRRGMMRAALELDSGTAQAIEEPLTQARQSELTARDIMNRQVRTVAPHVSLREAAQLMLESGVRRLPVVDADGTLRGMVTRADLLQAVMSSPLMSPHASSGTQPLQRTQAPSGTPAQQRPITDYLNTDAATVGVSDSIDDVLDALLLSPLKRVIVLNESRQVAGIISDVDVLAQMQEQARPRLLATLANWRRSKSGRLPTAALQTPAGNARVAADVMNRQVVTVAHRATVHEAIERMISTGRKILPVVDEEQRLLGTVGRTDLLRVLVEE